MSLAHKDLLDLTRLMALWEGLENLDVYMLRFVMRIGLNFDVDHYSSDNLIGNVHYLEVVELAPGFFFFYRGLQRHYHFKFLLFRGTWR